MHTGSQREEKHDTLKTNQSTDDFFSFFFKCVGFLRAKFKERLQQERTVVRAKAS